MPSLSEVKAALDSHSSPKQAKILSSFFKTGRGQYGEGDKFIGVKVPQMHLVANKYHAALPLSSIATLLHSKIHEHRLTALLMLVKRYEKGSNEEKGRIFSLYIKNLIHINNWDLVDLSASNIIGAHLKNKPKSLLFKLSRSKSLFIRRISIVSTYFFIKHGIYKETIAIAKILLEDKEDLIHKATGWMLREVGKRDVKVLERFLCKHAYRMPRTALRYSIEKFSAGKRKHYMSL